MFIVINFPLLKIHPNWDVGISAPLQVDLAILKLVAPLSLGGSVKILFVYVFVFIIAWYRSIRSLYVVQETAAKLLEVNILYLVTEIPFVVEVDVVVRFHLIFFFFFSPEVIFQYS